VREIADEVREFARRTGGVVFERQLDERLASGGSRSGARGAEASGVGRQAGTAGEQNVLTTS